MSFSQTRCSVKAQLTKRACICKLVEDGRYKGERVMERGTVVV